MDRHSETFSEQQSIVGNTRRLFVGLTVSALVFLFVLWRIESERMEIIRAAAVDSLVPAVELVSKPLQQVSEFSMSLSTHLRLAQRTEELELEVTLLDYWKERARILEQENAQLRDLLNAPRNPAQFAVSANVIADTSSQFRHSVLVNVGAENGVSDGWPALDGSGLAGRLSGVGRKTARVVLLADSSSRVPVKIVENDARGIAAGDGTLTPQLRFAPAASVSPGQQVVTSGDGGVFPPNLLLGDVILGADKLPRVRLQADLWNLDYVSLLRTDRPEDPPVSDTVISGAAESTGQ